MGLSPFSSCACPEQKNNIIVENKITVAVPLTALPNPNPRNFKIIRFESIRDFIITMVHYPDCKNFEGNKILVFRNISMDELLKTQFLDPHFCENKHLSPIARFKPTEEGWNMAKMFCTM